MDAQEKKYMDGFNSGYFLTQHDPQLARIILDAALSPDKPSEHAYGLSCGHDTYIVEQFKSQNKEGFEDTKTTPELTKEKLGDNYQRGFNSGYFLCKHEPELAEKIFDSTHDKSEYYQGLLGGKNEYEMEKIQDRLKDISKNKSPKEDKDMDMER